MAPQKTKIRIKANDKDHLFLRFIINLGDMKYFAKLMIK